MQLCEVFSSVQGEGPFVGVSTLFVRFGECDLRCAWCDTAKSWKAPRECQFETARGSQQFRRVANPVSLEQVLEACDVLELARHRFVSLTGGEPLLQAEAVLELARAIRKRGPRVHLETHGAAPDALEAVVSEIDVVSMDWKLGSDVAWAEADARDGSLDFHDVCERSLRTALRASEVYVKVVVSPNSSDAELDEMCARIAAVDPHTPLILQPVTAAGKVRESVDPVRLQQLMMRAEAKLEDVRLIPQTHKIYGLL